MYNKVDMRMTTISKFTTKLYKYSHRILPLLIRPNVIINFAGL